MVDAENMSSRRSKGIRASRWDREESSRAADERQPPRKGPAGLIFMCNSKTKRDCFHYKVLGLPLAKRDLVDQVVPGTFLFLFDFDVKELYGIYEASSQGGLNLEPKAFDGQGSYPAQVRFDIHRECLPLSEDVFRDAIKENYYSRNKFHFELTSGQVSKLIQLFCPVEPPRKRLHVSSASAAVQEAEGLRHGLLERTISAPVGRELVNRDPQYRLPTQALRIEERLPRHDPLVRLEPRPMIVDAPRLPQIRVLDERSDQKGLLTQGRLDEVDQLALKYLQGNPSVSSALDPYRRNTVLPLVEAPRSIVSLQQEAILRARALEAERLRRAASDRTTLREQGSLHLVSGPNLTVSSLAAIRSQQAAVSGSLRQLAGRREARRRQ